MKRKSNQVSHNLQLNSLLETSDFVETTNVGLVTYDAEGTVVDCNEAAAELFAHSQADFIGLRIDEQNEGVVRFDGSPCPESERPVVRCIREERSIYAETIGLDSLGKKRRWFSSNSSPLYVNGELSGVLSSYLDVTNEVTRRRMLELGSSVRGFVAGAHNEPTALQKMCEVLVDQGGYALACVAWPSPDGSGGCTYPFAAGMTEYLFTGISSFLEEEPRGRGPTGTAFRTGVTQTLNNFPIQASFDQWRDRAAQFTVSAAVAIPIAVSARAVVVIYDQHPFAFDEVLVKGLENVVREVELGVSLLRSVDQVRRSLEGTIRTLAVISESRDPYTQGHELRVGALSAAMAAHMGLDEGLVRLIRLSGEVHDVGKVSVPTEVLTRPGRLSSLEFALVKQHSVVGSEILTSALLPWPIPEVAAQHHERLDGSGYPFGLLGDEMILPARLIAVADVVEAMMNERSYRPAMVFHHARAEILAGRGTLYDPDVVDACLAVFEQGFSFEHVRAEGLHQGE